MDMWIQVFRESKMSEQVCCKVGCDVNEKIFGEKTWLER